jgi:hypothetical protein
MVNNSSNVNKIELLPLTSNHWTQKKDHNIWQEPGLEQAQKCGMVKPVNGIPTPPSLDNWIFNENKDTSKLTKKTYVNLLPLKSRTLSQKWVTT